jgi:hypothetical protein
MDKSNATKKKTSRTTKKKSSNSQNANIELDNKPQELSSDGLYEEASDEIRSVTTSTTSEKKNETHENLTDVIDDSKALLEVEASKSSQRATKNKYSEGMNNVKKRKEKKVLNSQLEGKDEDLDGSAKSSQGLCIFLLTFVGISVGAGVFYYGQLSSINTGNALFPANAGMDIFLHNCVLNFKEAHDNHTNVIIWKVIKNKWFESEGNQIVVSTQNSTYLLNFNDIEDQLFCQVDIFLRPSNPVLSHLNITCDNCSISQKSRDFTILNYLAFRGNAVTFNLQSVKVGNIEMIASNGLFNISTLKITNTDVSHYIKFDKGGNIFVGFTKGIHLEFNSPSDQLCLRAPFNATFNDYNCTETLTGISPICSGDVNLCLHENCRDVTDTNLTLSSNQGQLSFTTGDVDTNLLSCINPES